MAATLEKAVDAERREFSGRSGELSYYVAGEGAPILLLHSINAAASAYEVRPLFEHLRSRYRVYAPDLPGFGFSDRSRRRYDIPLYVAAVQDMLDVIAETHGDAAVRAVALSLSAEFLARVASRRPNRFEGLVLVNPTGFRRGSHRLVADEGETREMAATSWIDRTPGLRKLLFGLLVRPSVIRYFLKRTWGSDNYDRGLADYDDVTTHQPGAENAPLAFLSGRLFAADIRTVYESLSLPVWVPHGTKGDFGDFSDSAWAEARDNWRFTAYYAGALPHFEIPDDFFADLDEFLDEAS